MTTPTIVSGSTLHRDGDIRRFISEVTGVSAAQIKSIEPPQQHSTLENLLCTILARLDRIEELILDMRYGGGGAVFPDVVKAPVNSAPTEAQIQGEKLARAIREVSR